MKPFQTKINLELELPEPVYDLKQNIVEINKDHSNIDDWLTRNGMHKIWKSKEMARLGYAEGGAVMISGFSGQVKKYDKYGVYYCPYITEIHVAMMFRTRIVIPNNFKKGGCRFNMIHEHEYRHYTANREVALEFVEKFEHDLPTIIREIETAQPYVLGEKVPATLETLKASVADAIEIYIVEGMKAEMARRNDLIDTPEEYASSGPKLKACKD